MDNIPEIDFLKMKKDFKSTQFLTQCENPRKIILRNVIYKLVSPVINNEIKYLRIDLILNNTLNENDTTYIGNLKNIVYTFTNLRQDKKTMYLSNECDFDEYYSKHKKDKDFSKNKMIAYLILNEVKDFVYPPNHQIELKNPIKVLMQDEELHRNFGEAYTYYITSIIINTVKDKYK